MSLAALADVEAWLGLPSGNSSEPILTRLITSASAFVETWCSRSFELVAYTEPRDGNGQTRMTPLVSPVTAVSGVAIDGVAVPSMTPGSGPGFFLASRTIQLSGYRFSRGQMNVMLAYTAGYATTPPDVTQAVIELVAFRYRERDRIGLSSVHAAGETTSYTVKDMPPSVATLLQQYRQVVPR